MTKTTDHRPPHRCHQWYRRRRSLGQGVEDNRADRGAFGHPPDHASRRTTSTRRSAVPSTPPSSNKGASALTYELAELSALEAISGSGLSTNDFGGPLFLASPPVELDWRDRFSLYDSANHDLPPYERLLAVAREQLRSETFESTQFGAIADRLSDRFGARGLPITLSTACASGATAIHRRRGDPPSKLTGRWPSAPTARPRPRR